ncbi:MAG: hypothetical protein EOP86_12195 [Verrucomicrobiaceae bacterium]|nr:MAG: hypothetical protein EOP86_12195 [Verrucomicrobiaceae bacterium]
MKPTLLLAFTGLAVFPPVLRADPLLVAGDPVVAFDLDTPGNSNSDYPSDDSPVRALDGRLDTKYANGGKLNAGFIVTPAIPTAVQSFVITTAGDSAAADPASYQIAGTNDPITSTDNSLGSNENWTILAEGTFDTPLPTARKTVGTPVGFANGDVYKSYRILFPTVRTATTATLMHFSEIQFYPNADGTGAPVLAAGNPILAVQIPTLASSSPGAEAAPNVTDQSVSTKYLNFGKLNTGFIVTPSSGAKVIRSMKLSTANDAVERDPASYEIYGTNDEIVSEDHSAGDGESWTLVASGTLELPAQRLTEAPLVTFPNTTAYTSWRVVFPTVKNAGTANSMQLAELQFFTTEDASDEGVIVPGDPTIAVQIAKSLSSYRTNNEKPALAIDGNTATKYKNFAKRNSGFIVTPASGSSVAKSLVITTANDLPANDPTAYELYGTNSPITSVDNSRGDGENWTLISRGTLALPTTRQTAGPAVDFANTAGYTSYKLVAVTLRDPVASTALQLGEVKLFTAAGGAGTQVLSPVDAIIAIQKPTSASSSPGNEEVANVIDGSTSTKFLDFGKRNTGFIVTPAAGAKPITEIRISTANDAPDRDPTAYVLHGTNDPVLSPAHSEGSNENWTLVSKGALELPDDRFTESVVPISNPAAFTSWRLIFPSVKNVTAANSMQVSEVQFFTTGEEPILDPADPIVPVQLLTSESSSPAAEEVINAIDQDSSTKYLNFGRENSGIIVTPSAGPAAVTGFTLTTANDGAERDPVDWELCGTNDPILTGNHGEGNLENWTVVATGTLALPEDRLTAGEPVTFPNTTAYTSYRFRVISIKNPSVADSVQFADIQFEAGAAVPVDPSFQVSTFTVTGTSASLSWPATAGTSYTVQASTDLSLWSNKGTVVATGATASLTVPLTGDLSGKTKLWFRVVRN